MQKIETSSKNIGIDETSSILGVSSATVRNWMKQQYLVPLEDVGRNLMFDRIKVIELKDKISLGIIKRLDKRANKSKSTHTFIPDEYATNQQTIESAQSLVEEYKSKNLSKESFLFSIILNLLKKEHLISFGANLSEFLYKNEVVENEVKWWLERTKDDFSLNKYSTFLEKSNLSSSDDFLGIIYQSITSEGTKSEGGSYYTPKQIVDEIADNYLKSDSIVVDPCCGTGQFLISAAEKTKNPAQVWGFDIDETAVRIARINMILAFPESQDVPHIYCKNILREMSNNLSLFSDFQIPSFDVVLTNPPWGSRFAKTDVEYLRKNYPEITSGESFSYFLKAGLDLLKDDGILSFVLPESLLNIKTHKDIREIILRQTTIKKITFLDRLFKNVFTTVFRLDVQKTKPENSNSFPVKKNGIENEVDQSRFLENSDFRFDVLTNDKDIDLLDKIYKIEHLTLKNNAKWALGIVTGNNKKYISKEKAEDDEPILTGKNIKRFIASPAEKYINFIPKHFQQVAPEYKYRTKEKLLYKFISKELVFAYDNKQTLTLNSANILIPELNYPIKSILALFNSSLYQFIYQKKFGSLKILKGEIEQLPLPKIEDKKHKKIEIFTDKLLNSEILKDEKELIYQKLNEYIFDLFCLDSQEREYVRKSIKNSKL